MLADLDDETELRLLKGHRNQTGLEVVRQIWETGLIDYVFIFGSYFHNILKEIR